MHLAIQQGVDKINSLQADMLLGEEIDIELNKSMSRFINTKYGRNNKYRKGFEESQKRIDDLRTLVREYEAPAIYKERYNNDIWIDQFRLPSDYMYLVNQRSELYIDNCDPMQYHLDDSQSVSFFVVPFEYLYKTALTGATTQFADSIRVLADESNPALGDLVSTNVVSSAFTYPQDIDAFKNALLNPISFTNGFEWYWEEYGQLNYPGSFIITVDTIGACPWFNWDASITNGVSGVNTPTKIIFRFLSGGALPAFTDEENQIAYAQFTDDALGARRTPNHDKVQRRFAFNKFVQQDDIFKLLEDPFNTTKYTSPLTTIRGGYIDIYTSDIFIIDKVKITYIRKPREISLPLDVNCELPDHAHQEIVDMTISSILEGINDPRYKVHQLEVDKNE